MDKALHLQAIMDAGRQIHESVNTIDMIVSARLGVHRNDLRCLHVLEERPATPGEIAARIGLTSGSVTALLDRLVTAGFVERRRTCADRRSVEIAITPPRLAELRQIHVEIEAWIRDYYNDRPVAEIARTGEALGVFADLLTAFGEEFARQKSCPQAGEPQ